MATNDGNLYRQMLTPIEENLKRKLKKGVYEPELALLAFRNAIDVMAKYYTQGQVDFRRKPGAMPSYFTVPVRTWAAKAMTEDFEAEYVR